MKEFLENEKKLMEDALNGILLTDYQTIKYEVLFSVEDSISLFELDKKWNVNGTELINKIKLINNEEIYELIEDFGYGEIVNGLNIIE